MVKDITELFASTKNVASILNNEDSKVIATSLYTDDNNPNNNASLERAQAAIDGNFKQGTNVAIRTAKNQKNPEIIIDLGYNYKASEFDKIVMGYTNADTDAQEFKVDFSPNNVDYENVASATGYSYSATKKANSAKIDTTNYDKSVRYVKITITGGNSQYGYAVNEIALVLNVEVEDATIIIENKTIVDVPTIASKAYTGDVLKADVAASELYKVVTNEGGTDVGTYDVVLELNDPENYYWRGDKKGKAVSKTITFNVTKAENAWVSDDWTIDSWNYGEDAKAPTAVAKFGDVTYTYSTSEDGEYTVTIPKDAGTYFLKAEVAGTDNYEGIEPVVKSFKIEKAGNEWTSELALDSWTYGEEAKTPTASAKFGDVTYTYSTAVDGDYTDVVPENAGTYYVKAEVADTNNYSGLVATAEFTIAKAKQAAPEGITVLDSTLEENADGKIIGLTTDMEIRAEGEEEYVAITAEEITNVLSGTYYVRYKETGNYNASEDTEVVVGTGRKFTVTLGEGIGYVLKPVIEDNQVTYGTNYEFSVVISEGYQKGASFAVKVDDVAIEANEEGIYTIENITSDVEVIVEGIEEIPETTTVAPTTAAPTSKVKKPGKAKINKVYNKKKAAKKVKISLKKIKGADGYQVAIYKTKKNAKKNKKAIVKKFVRKTKVTVNSKKLKNQKKLFVKVRAYALDGKSKVYGKWSNVKSVKIKK